MLRFFHLPQAPVDKPELIVNGGGIRHIFRRLLEPDARLFQLASRYEQLADFQHHLAIPRIQALSLRALAEVLGVAPDSLLVDAAEGDPDPSSTPAPSPPERSPRR